MSDFEIGRNKFNFVRLDKPDNIIAWRLGRDWEGWNVDRLGIIKAGTINSDILKRIEVWDKLDEHVRGDIEKIEADVDYVIGTRMENARRGRKAKYPNIPKEIICSSCGNKVSIVPSVFVKKFEKVAAIKGIAYTIDLFIKEFQCTECVPVKRGRQPNPATAHLPHELECNGCHTKKDVTPSGLVQRARSNNMTPEEFLKFYHCQGCKKTRGQHFKGRKGKKGKMK